MPQDASIGELEESGVTPCLQTPGSLMAPPRNHTSQADGHLLPALGAAQLRWVLWGGVLRVGGPGRQPSAQSLDVVVLQVLQPV